MLNKNAIFGNFSWKEHFSGYIGHEGCEEIAFYNWISFDFLKLILDDAIEDIKMIFRFGLRKRYVL